MMMTAMDIPKSGQRLMRRVWRTASDRINVVMAVGRNEEEEPKMYGKVLTFNI